MGRRRVQVDKRRAKAAYGARFFKGRQEKYKKTTEVVTHAFHPRVLSNFSDKKCQKVWCFLYVVEVIGKWAVTSICIMTFLAANDRGQTNCTVGDTDSLVGMGRSRHHGRLERAKTESNWKHQHKAEGTEYFVWKAMFELEPYEADAGPRNFGAVTVLIELQKTFEKKLLIVVWNW